MLLFLACHASGLLKVPLYFDKQTVQGLIPMIGLNVVGLRFAATRSTNSIIVLLTDALFPSQLQQLYP